MPSELLPGFPHIRRSVTQADGHGIAKLPNGAEAFPAGQYFDFERWECEHCEGQWLMLRLFENEPADVAAERQAWIDRHVGCAAKKAEGRGA